MAAEKRGRQHPERHDSPSSKRQKPNHSRSRQHRNESPGDRGNSNPTLPTSLPLSPPDSNAFKRHLQDLVDSDDATVVHHATQLYNLLYIRKKPAVTTRAVSELNARAPSTGTSVSLLGYNGQKPIQPHTQLPALPPIQEPYLEEATFRHRSKAEELNYERLEFLGDAYIEIIATRILFSRFPHLTSGQQAQMREGLVRNETLANFAEAYGFGPRITHAIEDDRSKGWRKVLADVFEAYVAALILASPRTGFQTAEAWMTELWAPQLLKGTTQPVFNFDAKQEIARLVVAKGCKVEYKMERDMDCDRVTGKQKFWIGCYLTGWGYTDQWLGSGEGQSKVQAGAAAASDALVRSKAILADANAKKIEAFPNAKKLESQVV
ncbi:ribonuclease III [Lepidopterella palustris CBS 459.81]|uniref:Ribonuclease III n=1 Tax=Lepidopterella palustris CBS 459.81 TaxID=1314670 RepID=A0A8E2JHH0_9PEZI|nr:ribonuclease III [Lepidopterella palustris CBS 459.81]